MTIIENFGARNSYLMNIIKWQSCVKYLANMLSNDLCGDVGASAKKRVFINAVNRLNYIFSRYPHTLKSNYYRPVALITVTSQ